MDLWNRAPQSAGGSQPRLSPPALKDWPVASLQLWFWGTRWRHPQTQLGWQLHPGIWGPGSEVPWGDGSGVLGLGFLRVLAQGSFRVLILGSLGVLALGSGFGVLALGSWLWGPWGDGSGVLALGFLRVLVLDPGFELPQGPGSGVIRGPGSGLWVLALESWLWGPTSGSWLWVLALGFLKVLVLDSWLWGSLRDLALGSFGVPALGSLRVLFLGSHRISALGWFWLWGPSGTASGRISAPAEQPQGCHPPELSPSSALMPRGG